MNRALPLRSNRLPQGHVGAFLIEAEGVVNDEGKTVSVVGADVPAQVPALSPSWEHFTESIEFVRNDAAGLSLSEGQ